MRVREQVQDTESETKFARRSEGEKMQQDEQGETLCVIQAETRSLTSRMKVGVIL